MKRLGFLAFLLNRYSHSLICYDCYDTGPSNERCVKSKNCTGEACLVYEGEDMIVTTAFCLLNLPDWYQKRPKAYDAECWPEPDGKGKHCICFQNFCNKLRNRRLLSEGGMELPLANVTMVERNPLIDYDDSTDSEVVFTINMEHFEDANNNEAEDLVPIEIENYDYEDKLEIPSVTIRPAPPPLPPPLLTTRQLLLTRVLPTTEPGSTTHRSTDFYETIKGTKLNQHVIFPDQLLPEIGQNERLIKLASHHISWSFACFIIFCSNLFLNILY